MFYLQNTNNMREAAADSHHETSAIKGDYVFQNLCPENERMRATTLLLFSSNNLGIVSPYSIANNSLLLIAISSSFSSNFVIYSFPPFSFLAIFSSFPLILGHEAIYSPPKRRNYKLLT